MNQIQVEPWDHPTAETECAPQEWNYQCFAIVSKGVLPFSLWQTLAPLHHTPQARFGRHGASPKVIVSLLSGEHRNRPECLHCSLHGGIELTVNLPAEAQTAACLQHHRAVGEAGQLPKQLTYIELGAATATPLQILGCLISLPSSHNWEHCKYHQNVFRTESLTRVQQKQNLTVDQGYSELFGTFPFLFIFTDDCKYCGWWPSSFCCSILLSQSPTVRSIFHFHYIASAQFLKTILKIEVSCLYSPRFVRLHYLLL